MRMLPSGDDLQLTTARHGVKRFSLSEDESCLAFETCLWPEEIAANLSFTEMNTEQKAAWEQELDLRPYEITDIMYKRNEWFGMRKGEQQHCAVLDRKTNRQYLLGPAELETEFPAVSKDGRSIYFYGYPHSGTQGRNAELFSCSSDAGELKQLTDGLSLHVADCPVCAEDGCVICPIIHTYDDGGIAIQPWRVDPFTGEGHAMMTEQDEELSHGVFELCTSHTVYGNWREALAVGNEYYFLSSWRGRGNIGRKQLNPEGGTEIFLPSDGHVQSFDVADTGALLYTEGTLQTPSEVYYRDEDGHIKQLTRCNRWLDDYELADVEEFWVRSQDGAVALQVWLTHPAGQEPGKKYPAVLNIHGGPTCSIHADFWHEAQALAGAGMAVIMTNPRGSLGYGHAFCRGTIAWKPEAMQDLLDALDAALARGFIDEKRVGVTGGSYGGYSTNKLIGRTRRFAAAVTQRCLVNPGTSYGTGDMGYKSSNATDRNMSMLAYMEDRVRGNLLTYIDNIKIPLLILHGFRDYRCSFEQAEQMFVAMKDRNPEVPVRLVMFPEDNHDITRTGKPKNQIRHLQEMVDWFETYLKEASHE